MHIALINGCVNKKKALLRGKSLFKLPSTDFEGIRGGFVAWLTHFSAYSSVIN